MNELEALLAKALHDAETSGGWWGHPECEEFARIIAPTVVGIVQDQLTSALHPEFGSEWREPDGVIWQAVQQARGEKRPEKHDAWTACDMGYPNTTACTCKGT